MFEWRAQKGVPFLRCFCVAVAGEQKQLLVDFRNSRREAASPSPDAADVNDARERWWDFLRPARASLLDRTTREERAEERKRQKHLESVEAAKEAFDRTPAGRARLAYKRGHRLFQYEMETNAVSPTIIPGTGGSPPRETTDPVDILNSVTVEGWKLVSGKFIHSEMRNGAIGCYLFKRSQKRRLPTSDPWLA